MKTVKISGKKIIDVIAAEKFLRGAGFDLIGIVAANGPEPYVHVHLNDAEAKDPIEALSVYRDPFYIVIMSDKAIGASGVPEALSNGSDKHTLTIMKKDPVTGGQVDGSENIQISTDHMIPISMTQRQLVSGVATLTIGPTRSSGPVAVSIVDQGRVLRAGGIILRFV